MFLCFHHLLVSVVICGWWGASLGDRKFLVFAHHSAVMDGIDRELQRLKIPFFRIDGKTNSATRAAGIRRFQETSVDECQIALLSVTAANMGITLTAASLVVFAELHWTPSVLLQAEDRVHRVGQAQAVQIHYMIGRGTVDEYLWRMLGTKLRVVGSAVDGKQAELKMDQALTHSEASLTAAFGAAGKSATPFSLSRSVSGKDGCRKGRKRKKMQSSPSSSSGSQSSSGSPSSESVRTAAIREVVEEMSRERTKKRKLAAVARVDRDRQE